jgi:hypothetical protein
VHVKKLTWGNHRTSAFSLAAKGRVVAEKRATLSSFKSPFPRHLNALYMRNIWIPIRLKALGDTFKDNLTIYLSSAFDDLNVFCFKREAEVESLISKFRGIIKLSEVLTSPWATRNTSYFHIVCFFLNNTQCSKRDAVWLPFNDHIYSETVQGLADADP